MAPLKVGDKFPPTKFKYIPYTPETSEVTACGVPIDFDTEKVLTLKIQRVGRKEGC